MNKRMWVILSLVVIMLMCVACSEADKVNNNLSKQADYFEASGALRSTMPAQTRSYWKPRVI